MARVKRWLFALEGSGEKRDIIHFPLKKQAALVARGVMTVEQVNQSYQSWRGGMKRLDAHETVRRMDALYKQLFS